MKIKSNEFNGFISAQMKSNNSITFCGKLPAGAKVENIRIIGEVEVNGTKYVNPCVNDLDGVVVSYHSELEEIATAYFLEGVPAKVIEDVQNYVLADFEVAYIEVCAHCGR